MNTDSWTQDEVDALLRGVTGEDRATEDDWTEAMSNIPQQTEANNPKLLQFAIAQKMYWTGVVDALTGRIKLDD